MGAVLIHEFGAGYGLRLFIMGPHANDRVQVRRVFERNNAPEPGRWMAETCCSWQECAMAVPSAVGASMSRAATNVHADSARSIVAAMGREGWGGRLCTLVL